MSEFATETTFVRTGVSEVDELADLLEEAIEDCPNANKWGDANTWPDGRSIVEVIGEELGRLSRHMEVLKHMALARGEGEAGERPDNSEPGIQIDGQGLPPCVESQQVTP